MPELPEVESVVRGLKSLIIGKTISKASNCSNFRVREHMSDKEANSLSGAKILDIKRRAKYIIINLDGADLLIHLGMSGVFSYDGNSQKIDRHKHFEITFSDGTYASYTDPRRFGMVMFAKNHLDNKYIQRCGVEPLTDDFNLDYIFKAASKTRKPIKNFLMANEIVVGIGNIYASEILFMSGIDPRKPSNKVESKELEEIVSNSKKALSESIKNGGTTFKDYRNAHNEKGSNQNNLYVYGQKECKICHSSIEKIIQQQRATYFCPKCQN